MTAPGHDPSARPQDRPDLTEAVMRRLGLPGITPGELQRRRRRRAVLRVAVCVVVAAAVGLVVVLRSSHPQPSGTTIPSAIRNDLQRHGRTIDGTVRSIRGLGQQLPALAAPTPQPGEGQENELREAGPEPSV